MDFSASSTTLFRGLGGLTVTINRLQSEVNRPQSTTFTNQIPYVRRLLLKSLLRAIALASYAPSVGAGTQPHDTDAINLYKCLVTIFLGAKYFGGALFALSSSVVTDLIHHDPLCFRALDEAGVPDAFLDAVAGGIVPYSEAVCCVPNTIVALCLNEQGLFKVKKARALDFLVSVFASGKYTKVMLGDTASILGTGVDELFRHVPSLKDYGVKGVIIVILKALCVLGGDKELLKNINDAKNEDEMDIDSETSRTENTEGVFEAKIPPEAIESNANETIDTSLPECVSHAVKMLESLLSNQDTARRFVANGGVELLFRLYALPRMPPAFGSSSQSHPILMIFRSLTANHSQALSLSIKNELSKFLMDAAEGAVVIGKQCVPSVEPMARDNYVRLIASASGLTAIAATVGRNSSHMLSEICKVNYLNLKLKLKCII